MRTALCQLLGIEVPIFSAPMGFVAGVELAAAASNAGGLGILSFNGLPPAALREEIRRLRSRTDRPFGVNVLLDGPHLPFPIDQAIDVCLEERVPVLSTFWGDPTPHVEPAHAAGVRVVDQVGTVAQARRAARAGVDVIVAQGVEAGGHVAGEVTTLALVPRVVDEVSPIPVVAAGGIADARGVVAALALGAQGVMIGTRLIAAVESTAHAEYKRKVVEATEDQTVRTTLFGHGWPDAPHRTLRTPFVERWLPEEARGSEERADEPRIGETRIAGQRVPLLRFMGFPPSVDATGDLESMDFLAGQGVGLVREIQPVRAIIDELVSSARSVVGKLANTIERGRLDAD